MEFRPEGRSRVLQEALSVSASPLHLARAFRLSSGTAIDYAEIARNLMQHPIESIDRHPLD